MMIKTAEEFVRLRLSDLMEEYSRSADDSAPEEVWLEVIHKYPEMRKWVAHNKTVSQKILKLLAVDLDSNVRSMVATRRKAGEEILRKLAFDPDESVRLDVAANPKVTKEILLELLNDEWEEIVELARERLNQLEDKS